MEYCKSFKCTLRCIPRDEGSLIRWTFEYEILKDKIPDNTFPNILINFVVALSKDLDAHLMEMEGKKEPVVDVAAARA